VNKVSVMIFGFRSGRGLLRNRLATYLGAIFNFIAYYIIALPLGITLAFYQKTQLGLQGLWIGKSFIGDIFSIAGLFDFRSGCWSDSRRH
jgi:Na+-driven multidrug efflux pump